MDDNNKKPNSGGNIKTVRTYLSDMADTVRANEISVIKVALAEQNKNERENIYRQIEGTPVKKFWWFLGGIILIGVATLGIYYLINKKTENNIPQTVAKEETLISYDAITSVSDTTDLLGKITAIKNDSKTDNNGSIKFISLSKQTNGTIEKISTKDLFSLLKFSAPSSLIRSLSDSYMIGTYMNDKPHIFLIFQVKDYSYTYAGMLEWEKTLANDLVYLFGIDTTENKLQLAERKWQDLILLNKDARVLNNENDKPILYYLFNDKNTLIIADDEASIKEIISRLITKNIKPL